MVYSDAERLSWRDQQEATALHNLSGSTESGKTSWLQGRLAARSDLAYDIDVIFSAGKNVALK
jgi:hypothetical protein